MQRESECGEQPECGEHKVPGGVGFADWTGCLMASILVLNEDSLIISL